MTALTRRGIALPDVLSAAAQASQAAAPVAVTIADLQIGQAAVVRRVRGNGALRRRLMDMGLMRGVRVCLDRRAPLRDPLAISLRGYHLAIRCDEARLIDVDVIDREPQSP
jgi:ferrous iron transport protein A